MKNPSKFDSYRAIAGASQLLMYILTVHRRTYRFAEITVYRPSLYASRTLLTVAEEDYIDPHYWYSSYVMKDSTGFVSLVFIIKVQWQEIKGSKSLILVVSSI